MTHPSLTQNLRGVAVAVAAALVGLLAAVTPASAAPEPTFSPAPDTAANEGVRILIIGDSITGNPGCWRAHVWQGLTDAGREVNMVGTRSVDECGGVTNAAGETWDPDNTGISGITTAGIYVRIGRDGLLARTMPDAVVAMLGTNDLMGGRTADEILEQYTLLVELIRRELPNGPIVIAAPPPIAEDRCPGCQAHVDDIEARLPAWAAALATPDAPVIVAVHVDDFDPAEDMYDGIHPNPEGELKIAAALLPAVEAALDASAPPEEDWPWPALAVGLLALAAGGFALWWFRGHREEDDAVLSGQAGSELPSS